MTHLVKCNPLRMMWPFIEVTKLTRHEHKVVKVLTGLHSFYW